MTAPAPTFALRAIAALGAAAAGLALPAPAAPSAWRARSGGIWRRIATGTTETRQVRISVTYGACTGKPGKFVARARRSR